MEGIEQYRQIIRQLLATKLPSAHTASNSEVECQLIFDSEHDHFYVQDFGFSVLMLI